MDASAPGPQVDARSVRFELVAIAVLLLGGYVFGIVWVIPGLAAVVAVGLGLGPGANLFNRLFQAVAGRLKPATATEAVSMLRLSEGFAVIMLSLATVLWVIGLGPLGWIVALIEAGVCALHATTGVSVEAAVRDRFLGKRR
ncbi:MAG: hypothetical protein QOH10_197 [Actinomycetota bacterium]|jgi:hypothetical protein|nr:hypothetical protein [Actinomycetota bacterium]